MFESHFRLLASMPLFGAVSESALAFLLAESQHLEREAGDYFFKESEQGQSLFALVSGSALVIKASREGDVALCELGPGDCFGEMALIDFGTRSASVRAKTSCTALELTLRAFYQLQKTDLYQYTLIQLNLARELSRRLRDADTRIFELSLRTGQFDPALSNWKMR